MLRSPVPRIQCIFYTFLLFNPNYYDIYEEWTYFACTLIHLWACRYQNHRRQFMRPHAHWLRLCM